MRGGKSCACGEEVVSWGEVCVCGEVSVWRSNSYFRQYSLIESGVELCRLVDIVPRDVLSQDGPEELDAEPLHLAVSGQLQERRADGRRDEHARAEDCNRWVCTCWCVCVSVESYFV